MLILLLLISMKYSFKWFRFFFNESRFLTTTKFKSLSFPFLEEFKQIFLHFVIFEVNVYLYKFNIVTQIFLHFARTNIQGRLMYFQLISEVFGNYKDRSFETNHQKL